MQSSGTAGDHPHPRETISYSPAPKSTRRICFKLTASHARPGHIRTHTLNPLQTHKLLSPGAATACRLATPPRTPKNSPFLVPAQAPAVQSVTVNRKEDGRPTPG